MSDSAVATIVTGLVTMVTLVVGFLTLWVRLKYGADKVERKIDINTALTKAGTEAAATNAKVAASAATKAADKAEALAVQMNGGLDDRMIAIVKAHTEPLASLMELHSKQDDKNMAEIRLALGELRDQVKAKR